MKLLEEMPKVPKMPKAVRPRGSRQVNVFYLFYENRNSRQVVISLFWFLAFHTASVNDL